MDFIEYKKNLESIIPKSVSREAVNNAFNSFSNSLPEILEEISKEDNILDVGCGAGFIINYLSLMGYKVDGFDKYLYSSATKKMNYSINKEEKFNNCSIAEFKSNTKYDLIFLNNVVEHLDDWKTDVDHLNNLLSSNGRIIFLFPNYNFPLEPHFMIPIFFTKNLTYRLFRMKIKKFEEKNGKTGLWDSLNFIKPQEIKNYYKERSYNASFDKEHFCRLIIRTIKMNRNESSQHKNNFLRNLLVLLGQVFISLKIIFIFKYLPLGLHPFVKLTVRKP